MKIWTSKIAGGFAGWDAPYLLHPNDETRAIETVGAMRSERIAWPEAERAFRQYPDGLGTRGEKLERQMQRVAAFVIPRLRD